jgi:hypothetical protein
VLTLSNTSSSITKKSELIHRLREEARTEQGRRRLGGVTGNTDQAVLDELLHAGIRTETLVALSPIPLVHVAWADPIIDADERDEILKTAEARGAGKSTASHLLLSSWLEQKPEARLSSA